MYTFAGCSSLQSVTIPDSVTIIGTSPFEDCSSLQSMTIPDSVTTIGMRAFEDCGNLASVTIPDKLLRIGTRAFNNSSIFKSINFEGNAPALGSHVFKMVSNDARIFINPNAIGFGETFGGLPVQILKKKSAIKSFSNHAAPFSLTFETESNSTYKIEASHDMQKWSEIGEVQGTGSSVKFIERRKALFPKQYYRVKLVE